MDTPQTRENRRYAVSLPVDCSTREVFLSSRVTNLSAGGLFVESTNAFPVGTEVGIVLAVPGGARVQTRGRVVWTFDPRKNSPGVVPGMGIRFLDLSVEGRRQLADVLSLLSRSSVSGSLPRGVIRPQAPSQ